MECSDAKQNGVENDHPRTRPTCLPYVVVINSVAYRLAIELACERARDGEVNHEDSDLQPHNWTLCVGVEEEEGRLSSAGGSEENCVTLFPH